MAQDDAVTKAVSGAKTALANATKFTQSVEGNPTSSFAPKAMEKPKIPQVHASAANASYKMVPRAGGHEPVGGTSSGEINQRLEQNKEAGSIADEMNLPH